MAVNIHNLIAALNPDVYCDPLVKTEVKEIAMKEGYLKASEKAKPLDLAPMDLIDIKFANPADKKGLGSPVEKHMLIYDSFGESLEPIYFWIIDRMNDEFKKVDKLVDSFVSSPGSGHFSELGAKATKMQEEAMKMLGSANQVVKSILNIIYDLKEFQLRLSIYDDYRSADSAKKNAALFSLKQVWMDTVDIKRGTTALKGLAQQFDYVTLIDAFMAADSLEKVTLPADKGGLDLNERVRRILQQRIAEFFRWVEISEKELRKRFEIERIYLRSQVNSAKLYARWVKPYLRASHQLEQRATETASLVSIFNTTLMELMVLGEVKYDTTDDVQSGELPKSFKNLKARSYSSVLIVEFKFRSAPERSERGYGFRGRTDVVFTSYGLNDEELKLLRKEIEKDDLGDIFSLMDGSTEQSIEQISEDIEEFLKEEEHEEKKKKSVNNKKDEKKSDDSNPFSALFSPLKDLFSKGDKKSSEKKSNIISRDSFMEEVLRSQAIIKARAKCYRVYDLYKKAHGMPSLHNVS